MGCHRRASLGRAVNEHAEARRAKAAAAAALLKSPGNGVVATAKREMAALSPLPDGTAEQGGEGRRAAASSSSMSSEATAPALPRGGDGRAEAAQRRAPSR